MASFVRQLIEWHSTLPETIVARDAENYDKQRNTTIMNYARVYYTLMGAKRVDNTASNNRIASNFFHRLNTQRVTYSLGNGVTFADESTKEKLGKDFDTRLTEAGYKALIHGISYLFWNVDHLHVFEATEFAPLWDEETGALMAGVRYWQIDPDKPRFAVLYEIDGYQKFKADSNYGEFKAIDEKKSYRYTLKRTPADEEPEIIAAENYSALPIIPLYGTRQRQSTLVGMKAAIDSFDLIRSGFANDLTDCAECYWIISNADGMDDSDLAKFRDRLKLNHIVTAEDGQVQPYTQEIPYQARQEYLNSIRAGIYEDFGALDVHTIAAGATNDHIDAGYQPMDEQADDFEYQVIEAVRGVLALIGVDDVPVFKRNRISNQIEQTNMVLSAATYLDDETILTKLPFITPDEVAEILKKKDEDDFMRFNEQQDEQNEQQNEQNEQQDEALTNEDR